jgi:hypothetical protein
MHILTSRYHFAFLAPSRCAQSRTIVYSTLAKKMKLARAIRELEHWQLNRHILNLFATEASVTCLLVRTARRWRWPMARQGEASHSSSTPVAHSDQDVHSWTGFERARNWFWERVKKVSLILVRILSTRDLPTVQGPPRFSHANYHYPYGRRHSCRQGRQQAHRRV